MSGCKDSIFRCIENCLAKLGYYQYKWRIRLAFQTFFGRLFHGCISKPDLWSVDMFLATKIAKVIRRFAEMKRRGVPISVNDMVTREESALNIDMLIWDAIIWKMVDGFERMSDDEYCCRVDLTYEQEALDLFAEFFFNLWD